MSLRPAEITPIPAITSQISHLVLNRVSRSLVLPVFLSILSVGDARAQNIEPVLDAYRLASISGRPPHKGSIELEYSYAGDGLVGVVTYAYDRSTGDFVEASRIGPTDGGRGFDGRKAWMRDMSGATTLQDGGDTRQLPVNEAYRNANLWWNADRGGALISHLGIKAKGNHKYAVLRVTPQGGKAFEAWFDEGTHLLARTVENRGFQTITTTFANYRRVDNGLLASTLTTDDGSGGKYLKTENLSSVKLVVKQPGEYSMPTVDLAKAGIDNNVGETTVPFKLLNNHIYADVLINSKGPFLCLVDTGGFATLTPTTAKSLGVMIEGQSNMGGAGAGLMAMSYARGLTFQIGALKIENQPAVVLPFTSREVEGFDARGMIGFEVFRRFVTRIDYGSRTLTFTDPRKFKTMDAGTPVPFVFYHQLPEVDGSVEGIRGRFNIDTGSRLEITLTKPFVDAHDLRSLNAKGVIAVDGWGVGGPVRSYVTRVSPITLGPVRINDVVAGLATQNRGGFADPNYEGNVGSGLLKRFVVTFDYGHEVMYLKPLPKPVVDSGTYDHAGMWINASPVGFKIVALTEGGPAKSAGLKIGDEITKVDGVAAGSIPLSDLRRDLRDKDAGTRVALVVLSGDVTRAVVVTLRDQV